MKVDLNYMISINSEMHKNKVCRLSDIQEYNDKIPTRHPFHKHVEVTAMPGGSHDPDNIGVVQLSHHDDFLCDGLHHCFLLRPRIPTKGHLQSFCPVN